MINLENKSPAVVIVIPNYNGSTIKYRDRPIIDACLNSLSKTTYKNYKIVITDDSTDNSLKYLRNNYKNLKFTSIAPTGYSENANNGIKYAMRYYPDYIILLDNDVIIIDKNWLSKMINVAEGDKSIGIVGCQLLSDDKTIRGTVVRLGDRFGLDSVGTNEWNVFNYNKIIDAQTVSGAVFLMKISAIKKVGFLDENFRNGYNDDDYCLRTLNAGMRVVFDGKVKCIHIGSVTNENIKTSNNFKALYFNMRNRFYFLRKHRGRCGPIRSLVWHMIYFSSGVWGRNPAKRFFVSLKAFLDANYLKMSK